MTTFSIHLIGQALPISLDLPCANIDDLAEASATKRFLTGYLASAGEDGVCQRVMIATSRIQCAIET